MATIRETYAPIELHGVAPLWPATVPELTPEAATNAARRLWRFALGGSASVAAGRAFGISASLERYR